MAGELWKTVGDYVSLQRGITYSGTLVGEPGPALLGLGSIEPGGGFRAGHYKTFGGECPAKIMLVPGDVYVALKGATKDGSMVGSVARLPESVPSGRLTQDTARLDFAERDPEAVSHLYWVLRTPQYRQYCAGRLTGSAAASFSRDDFLSYPVPPVTNTSRAIVRLLDAIESWFVDFDPVRAKAEGRDPGLPKPIADLFPDSFEDSELGEIPRGWEVKTIEAIATRVGMGPFGSSIKVESFVSNGVPVISGQHLRGFMLDDTTFNFLTQEHAERLKAANVQRSDVVFTHAGNIGQVAYIPENSRYDRYVISQRQFFMRCDPAQVTPTFMAFYFRSPEGQHRLLANASSSGVPSIARPVTYLRSIRLTIPSMPIMEAFEKMVQPLLLQFRRNLDEGNTLATMRDTLLPKLISGKLRVKDAVQGVEATA
jgi:hypothetical protein